MSIFGQNYVFYPNLKMLNINKLALSKFEFNTFFLVQGHRKNYLQSCKPHMTCILQDYYKPISCDMFAY